MDGLWNWVEHWATYPTSQQNSNITRNISTQTDDSDSFEFLGRNS